MSLCTIQLLPVYLMKNKESDSQTASQSVRIWPGGMYSRIRHLLKIISRSVSLPGFILINISLVLHISRITQRLQSVREMDRKGYTMKGQKKIKNRLHFRKFSV